MRLVGIKRWTSRVDAISWRACSYAQKLQKIELENPSKTLD